MKANNQPRKSTKRIMTGGKPKKVSQIAPLDNTSEHLQNLTEMRPKIYEKKSSSSQNLSVVSMKKMPDSIVNSIKKSAQGNRKPKKHDQMNKTGFFQAKLENLKGVFTCQICLCQYPKIKKAKLCDCSHQFCNTCLTHYFNYKVSMFQEVFCPAEQCQQIINTKQTFFIEQPYLNKKRYHKIHNFFITSKDPNLRLCPKQSCQDGILHLSEGIDPICTMCRKTFCRNCFLEAHQGQCQSHQINFFQNKLLYRQCNKCKAVIQRIQGCNHITCKCGYQFCYICGQRWNGNGHLCPLSQDQLQQIQGCLCDNDEFYGIPKFFGRLLISLPMFILLVSLQIAFFLIKIPLTAILMLIISIPMSMSVGCQVFQNPFLQCMMFFIFPIFIPFIFLKNMYEFFFPSLINNYTQSKRTIIYYAYCLFR